jgi:hypothetical protein
MHIFLKIDWRIRWSIPEKTRDVAQACIFFFFFGGGEVSLSPKIKKKNETIRDRHQCIGSFPDLFPHDSKNLYNLVALKLHNKVKLPRHLHQSKIFTSLRSRKIWDQVRDLPAHSRSRRFCLATIRLYFSFPFSKRGSCTT